MLHVQLVVALLLDGEEDPFGQFKHAEDPITSLKVPPGQVAQTCPSGPVKPMLHLQLVRFLEPGEVV